MSAKFVRLIQNIYNKATLQINQGVIEIPITDGVLQGESISPTLFNLIPVNIVQAFCKE